MYRLTILALIFLLAVPNIGFSDDSFSTAKSLWKDQMRNFANNTAKILAQSIRNLSLSLIKAEKSI